MSVVGSLRVELEPDGDGWIAHDPATGEVIRRDTWAEVLWECQVRRRQKRDKEQ
jgi:hypothetical protein